VAISACPCGLPDVILSLAEVGGLKRGTPRHPKVGRLCEILGINVPTAVGLLELLWHFTAEFAPQGDIGKYDDNRIEAALLSWFRPKGKLILALVQAGWIDQDEVSRLIVHDWRDHAEASVRKRLDRAGLQFVSVTPRVTGQRIPTLADGGCLPLPSPSQAKPQPHTTDAAADTAAACKTAEDCSDLSDEERAEAWKQAQGNGTVTTNGAAKRSLLNPETETVLDQVARRIHARHPAVRRCGMAEVKNQLRAIVRRAAPAKRIDLLHRVDQNHAAWCATADWQKDGGQYAKGLENWLAPTKERWNEPPANAKGASDAEPPRLMM
jgi:hypothetical protein